MHLNCKAAIADSGRLIKWAAQNCIKMVELAARFGLLLVCAALALLLGAAQADAADQLNSLDNNDSPGSIAQCEGGGSGGLLKCGEIFAEAQRRSPQSPKPTDPRNCPDDLSKGKFMSIRSSRPRRRARGTPLAANKRWPKTQCTPFSDKKALEGITTYLSMPIPQAKVVLTKASTLKNHGGSKNSGLILFKRVVCTEKYKECQTYKSARCIDCSAVRTRSREYWFKSVWADQVPRLEVERFAKECVPLAFNKTTLKDEFACSKADMEFAKQVILTF